MLNGWRDAVARSSVKMFSFPLKARIVVKLGVLGRKGSFTNQEYIFFLFLVLCFENLLKFYKIYLLYFLYFYVEPREKNY